MNERPFDEQKADAILQQALKHLGWKEDPPGSNHGDLADRAIKFVGYPTSYPTGPPWCAAFACLMVHDAGILDGPKTASTGGIVTWGKMHDAIVPQPRRGDIGCLIDSDSPTGFEHTVILEHVFGGESVVHTVAANEANRVQRNTYPIHSMVYVRPYRV